MAERAQTEVGLSLDHLADSLAELDQALETVATLGVESVEIFLPALGVVLGGRLQRRRLAELRRICEGRPFGFTLHGPLSADLGDRANAALQRAVAEAGLEAAAAIGATVYVQHQTIAPDQAAAHDRLACEREALAALAPVAKDAGAVLGVETMFCRPGQWTALPHELAEQVAAVGHPAVGAVLDFGHAALNAGARGAELLGSLAPLAPLARHLHIHDGFAQFETFRPWTRGDAMSFGFGDLHLPPGDGDLDWSAFATLDLSAARVANLELDRRWALDLPEAVAWTRRWIEEGPRLRRPRRRAAGERR